MIPAIVLAGGLGTRLRSVVSDAPKVLAPVAGRPFLEHLLARLAASGCDRVVLAVGYLREQIHQRIGARIDGMTIDYSIEESPLGTGGALRKALQLLKSPRALVLNGDTWMQVDYGRLIAAHEAARCRLTVTVVHVTDVARYGAVEISPDGRISRFAEKGERRPGEINGGTYVVERDLLERGDLPFVFSFEQFLVRQCLEVRPLAFRTDGPFIDIGIPSDYALAENLLARLQ